ncbi:MAG TPA: alpha/beta fold hydrolase [Candidatus Acidoferrales bacterium]|nr:alpha/beta fold hydrolase [Candidatus Acidoferrales bacterium]
MSTRAIRANAETASKPDSETRVNRRVFWLAGVALILVALFAYDHLRYDLRSYALLTHFSDPHASGPILNWETEAIKTEDLSIATPAGPIRARLYSPVGVTRPHGLVAVPGIHRLGIDEPRLASLSRAMAATGLAVLTPEMTALADYHVDAASIATIGESAAWLAHRLGSGPVTVTGISFAGGLSLLAASDPVYAPNIRALVLMGAYDDLARATRYLATSQEVYPDGTTVPFAAHDYGASVFVYAHLNQFFPARDLPAAHEALRYWLWEEPQNSTPFIAKLSPASQAIINALMARKIEVVRPQILKVIQGELPELAAISPHGHLAGLRVPVYVLHGSADNVIPPAESLWLEKDIPPEDLREFLITGAFSHVDPKKDAGLGEELRLVDFIANVLRAAD